MKHEKFKMFFGARNLRTLDLSMFELRPITILVGRNHSGKSTLLRSFPLLKQTIISQNSAPILWCGDLVDFGSFGTSVKRSQENDGIRFEFGLENFKFMKSPVFCGKISDKVIKNSILKISGLAKITVLLKSWNENTIRVESQLDLPDHNLHLIIKSNPDGEFEKITLNGLGLPNELQKIWFGFHKNHILSEILPLKKDFFGYDFMQDFEFENLIKKLVSKIIETNTNGKVTEEQIHSEGSKILRYTSIDKDALTRLISDVNIATIKKFYQTLIVSRSKILDELDLLCGFFSSLTVYNQVCQYFSAFLRDMLYYNPRRTIDSRYFRILGSSELCVLPDGSNLSRFFESLSKTEMSRFSNWLKENFGYGISLEKMNGRISIFVEQGGIVSNIVDSGFGISQSLPFLAQIWHETFNFKQKPRVSSEREILFENSLRSADAIRKLIAIEQPELHLHPVLQAKIIEVLVNTIHGQNSLDEGVKIQKPMYIIETHSESIINRLGELVRKQKVSHNDIQILIFSKEEKDGEVFTKVSESNYNECGHLENWSYGFFRYSLGV